MDKKQFLEDTQTPILLSQLIKREGYSEHQIMILTGASYFQVKYAIGKDCIVFNGTVYVKRFGLDK